MKAAGITHGVILAVDRNPENVDRPEISDMLEAAYNNSTQSNLMPFENLKKHIKVSLGSGTYAGNEDAANWVSEHPEKLIGFGSVDLSKDGAYVGKKLESLAKLGMRGINLLAHFQFFYPSRNKNIDLLLEFCSDMQMIVLSHSGCGHGPFEILELCRNAHPALWEPCLIKYPDFILVMAHFGAYRTRGQGDLNLCNPLKIP